MTQLVIDEAFGARLAAAMRHGLARLQERPNRLRLLLLALTDRKPNDVDHYEAAMAVKGRGIASSERPIATRLKIPFGVRAARMESFHKTPAVSPLSACLLLRHDARPLSSPPSKAFG